MTTPRYPLVGVPFEPGANSDGFTADLQHYPAPGDTAPGSGPMFADHEGEALPPAAGYADPDDDGFLPPTTSGKGFLLPDEPPPVATLPPPPEPPPPDEGITGPVRIDGGAPDTVFPS